jgi:hypothetical protein
VGRTHPQGRELDGRWAEGAVEEEGEHEYNECALRCKSR